VEALLRVGVIGMWGRRTVGSLVDRLVIRHELESRLGAIDVVLIDADSLRAGDPELHRRLDALDLVVVGPGGVLDADADTLAEVHERCSGRVVWHAVTMPDAPPAGLSDWAKQVCHISTTAPTTFNVADGQGRSPYLVPAPAALLGNVASPTAVAERLPMLRHLGVLPRHPYLFVQMSGPGLPAGCAVDQAAQRLEQLRRAGVDADVVLHTPHEMDDSMVSEVAARLGTAPVGWPNRASATDLLVGLRAAEAQLYDDPVVGVITAGADAAVVDQLVREYDAIVAVVVDTMSSRPDSAERLAALVSELQASVRRARSDQIGTDARRSAERRRIARWMDDQQAELEASRSGSAELRAQLRRAESELHAARLRTAEVERSLAEQRSFAERVARRILRRG
jgi:hypothetical protein